MLVAAFGFAVMGALVKIGAQKFSAAELVFYRSAFGLITIWLFIAGKKLPLSTPHLRKHLSRSLVGFASLVLFFYAIAHLPLATAITLNYTSPLFLAAIMPFLLHEKPKGRLIIALIIGFIGVTLLLKPTFDKDSWGAGVVGLLSGVGAAIAYVNVKQLGQLQEPDWRTVYYFTLVSSIGAGLWMLFDTFHAVSWNDVITIGGLGLSATLAQLAMTRAYRTGKTLVVASLAYTTIVFASLISLLLWQEYLGIDAWLAIGLIVSSGLISLHSSANKTK